MLQTTILDACRGRVYDPLGALGALLELIGVGVASILGKVGGVLPLLNVAAMLTIATGIVALLVLPDAGAN